MAKTIKMIGHDSQELEERLIELKKDFLIKYSSYTTIIECGEFRYIFNDEISEPDFKFIDGYKKILEDLPKAPEIDFVNKENVSYFDIHPELPDEIKLRTAYNVDIKSAYIRCALNFGIISQETFDFLQTLEKPDRLKAFGMLATSYACFEFKAGELIKSYLDKNEDNRKYFFAVCGEIGNLMNRVKSELFPDFIFYWVDGIYFSSKSAAKKAADILTGANYSSSFDELNNFSMLLDDFRYTIKFGKKGEMKVFTIPKITPNYHGRGKIRELSKFPLNSRE